MSIFALLKLRVVTIWALHIVPIITSPKVFCGTSWTVWLMRKEVGMVIGLSSLGWKYITARNKATKKRVTCQICDRLMIDIMEAAEDVVDIPCSVMCLRWKSCVEMCEKLKDISQDSDSYPCIEGGYCPEDGWFDHELAELGYKVPDCHFEGGIRMKCEPSSHCHKVFKGLHFQCKMKPGAAKWVGMQRLMATSAGVLTSAMKKWPRCSENGASHFCIAEPSGTGYIAEILSNILIFVWGGYKSIVALTTSGGDDDQEMLVFWLIITFILHVEGYFRVLMSQWFPPYFEMKCIFIVWLMFFGGTEKIFRSLLKYWDGMRSLFGLSTNPEDDEIKELNRNNFLEAIDGSKSLHFMLPVNFATWHSMQDIKGSFILRRVGCFERYYKKKKSLRGNAEMALDKQKVYYTRWSRSSEDLVYLYSYIYANRYMLSEHFSAYHWWLSVTEASASCVSFHPKFLKISLRRAYNIPSMDGEHKDSDVYAVLMIECPAHAIEGYRRSNRAALGFRMAKTIKYGKVRSKTKFNTSMPVWNEDFEMELKGGTISSTGLYQNHAVRKSTLLIHIQDEDYWQVSMFFQIASAVLTVLIAVLFFIAIFEYPYFTAQRRLEEVLQGNDFLLRLIDVGMTVHTKIAGSLCMSDGRLATIPFMILFCCIVVFQALRIMWDNSTEKDDLIGFVKVPLSDLLDQQEHYYKDEPVRACEEEKNCVSDSKTASLTGGRKDKVGLGKIDFAVRLLEA